MSSQLFWQPRPLRPSAGGKAVLLFKEINHEPDGLNVFTIASLPMQAMIVSHLLNFTSQGTYRVAMVARLGNRHSHHNWSIEASWTFPAYPKT